MCEIHCYAHSFYPLWFCQRLLWLYIKGSCYILNVVLVGSPVVHMEGVFCFAGLSKNIQQNKHIHTVIQSLDYSNTPEPSDTERPIIWCDLRISGAIWCWLACDGVMWWAVSSLTPFIIKTHSSQWESHPSLSVLSESICPLQFSLFCWQFSLWWRAERLSRLMWARNMQPVHLSERKCRGQQNSRSLCCESRDTLHLFGHLCCYGVLFFYGFIYSLYKCKCTSEQRHLLMQLNTDDFILTLIFTYSPWKHEMIKWM